MTVWIVKGIAGSYDDKTEWIVCGFTTEKLAKSYVEQLNNWCKSYGCDKEYGELPEFNYGETCPLDKYFMPSYAGVYYSYCSIEVKS